MYLIKTPWWLRALYPQLVWHFPGKEKLVYLTFDDGPHPVATRFALDQLKQYNAKATFFCIGKNVLQHQDIYNTIIAEGHSVGNHTYNHINGWKADNDVYYDEVIRTAKLVNSNLFRPPYGKIKRSQIRQIQSITPDFKLQAPNFRLQIPHATFQTIMWDVLSADFDTRISPDTCLQNVLQHTRSGSILLFHDSEKAWPRMQYALPKMLSYFTQKGYRFEGIQQGSIQ